MPLSTHLPATLTPARLQPPIVLLVEDHADSRELYAFDLRHSGFRVEEAQNTTEAIRSVAAALPDVVVADLQLPDHDGLQLCRTLKETAPTKDIPVIAITANASVETKRAAEAAGCAAVLVKPCVPAAVRAEIERVLSTGLRVRERSDAALERAQLVKRKSAMLRMKSERLQALLNQQIASEAAFTETLGRVRAEFKEMPGLHLTVAQAARLLGMDHVTAARLLDRLVAEGFLRRSGPDMYLRAV